MADNVFRVTLTGIMYGQQCQNVIHFSGPSSDPGQMSALADEFQAGWITRFRNLISGDVTWVSIQVRLLESQFATFTKTISVTGNTGTSNQFYSFACYCLRLRAATIGKRSRGRVYFPGVQSGVTTLGFWTSTIVENWNVQIANVMAIFGPGGSSTFRLGIGPKTGTTANFKEVVQMQLAPTPTVQRRRNIGIGV
jgi:hypothetical protein